jgi:hypothetical protein
VEDALTSGARIGSYEVIDRPGAAGMGEVLELSSRAERA